MIGVWCERLERFDIASQLVRHDDTRFAKAGYQPSEETLCCLGVSPWLHWDVQNVAVRIHCSPKPYLHTVDREDNFVQVPFIGSGGTVALDAIGEMPAKPVYPFAHGFPADRNDALGQQILDIRRAEAKTDGTPKPHKRRYHGRNSSLSGVAYWLVSSWRSARRSTQGQQAGNAVVWFHAPLSSSAIAFAVSLSAGKKASIVTSDNVTSTAVPKTVVVVRNDNDPRSVFSRKGTATA
ncbi:hypothetical protein SAMN05444398_107180 [Roseovarius pacificus]|uniref:Uncharacterized protein n=1 Tax=Roseovarius pacificus TaxID=337701 RepID=A0A1M7ERU1_9RHOB|nr:hypothetical protein SAMN05444398_107180 [Roseovarius pacificus]